MGGGSPSGKNMTLPSRVQNVSHKLFAPPGWSARARGRAGFGATANGGRRTYLSASVFPDWRKRSKARSHHFNGREMYLQLSTKLHNLLVSFCIAIFANSPAKTLSKDVDICTKKGVASHIDPVTGILGPRLCLGRRRWKFAIRSKRPGSLQVLRRPNRGLSAGKKHSQCAEKTEQLCFKETA